MNKNFLSMTLLAKKKNFSSIVLEYFVSLSTPKEFMKLLIWITILLFLMEFCLNEEVLIMDLFT